MINRECKSESRERVAYAVERKAVRDYDSARQIRRELTARHCLSKVKSD